MVFEINSHFDHVKVNLIVGAIIAAGVMYYNRPVVHEPPAYITTASQEAIVVEAGSYSTHYQLKERINEPFLVTAIFPQTRRSSPLLDFHSQFVTFTPKSTGKYMKKYAGKTHCPASFLNRHADHISLYAANPDIAKKLAGWKQKNGSQVSRWEVVNITGQCLGKRTKIEKNGEDVTKSTRLITLGRKASRDCHMIYVENIEETDVSLQDYVRG